MVSDVTFDSALNLPSPEETIQHPVTVDSNDIPNLETITDYDNLTLPLTIRHNDGSIMFLSNVKSTHSYWRNDKYFIINIGDGIYFWDIDTQSFSQSIAGSNLHFNFDQNQYFVNAGHPLSSSVINYIPEVRDWETNELLYDFEYPTSAFGGGLDWLDDGKILVAFDLNADTVRIWDAKTGELTDEIMLYPYSINFPSRIVYENYVHIQYRLADNKDGYLENGSNQLNYIIKVDAEGTGKIIYDHRSNSMALTIVNNLLYTIDETGELTVIDLLTDQELYHTNVGNITRMGINARSELSSVLLMFWNEELYSIWRLTGDREHLTEELFEVELDPTVPFENHIVNVSFG